MSIVQRFKVVPISEVEGHLRHAMIGWGQVVYPLYRGCPLLMLCLYVCTSIKLYTIVWPTLLHVMVITHDCNESHNVWYIICSICIGHDRLTVS